MLICLTWLGFVGSRGLGLYITAGFGAVILVSVAIWAYGTALSVPQALFISLVGYPGSGKTVFLTMLFYEMMTYASTPAEVQFAPYGPETTQGIAQYHQLLANRVWPPSTVEPFPMRATAALGWAPKRYHIILTDRPGHESEDLADQVQMPWMHRTEYFRQIVGSDAVFIVVDCGLIVGDRAKASETETKLIASVVELVTAKAGPFRRTMQTPLAILFLKADLLGAAGSSLLGVPFEADTALAIIEHSVQKASAAADSPVVQVRPSPSGRIPFGDLVRLCERSSAQCAFFFIQAVGEVGPDELPPVSLAPGGVIDPLLWVLQCRYHRQRGERHVESSALGTTPQA